MTKLKKEQQQVAVLVTVLVTIVGVMLYMYRDKFVPIPSGEAIMLPPATRITVPRTSGTCQDDKTACASDADCAKLSGTATCTDPLYKRDEFKSLKRFGDVPVRPLETAGSPEPFITDTEEAR